MFSAALLSNAKSQNQLVTYTWMYKANMVYIVYLTQPKKNEIIVSEGKWVELEIILHEISQSHTDKYYMFVFFPSVEFRTEGKGHEIQREHH